MKRAFLFTLALALVLSLPALSQDGEDAENAQLQKDVEELTEVVKRQGQEIKDLKAYVSTMKGEAVTLAAQLKKAEKEGFFYPAPHVPAKKALLGGLQRYASVAATGKAPAK